MSSKSSAKSDSLIHLMRRMRDSHDTERCVVAPHPNLRDSLKKKLDTARGTFKGPMSNNLRLTATTSAGLNDGLIYPGVTYPLGTPLRVARSGAADRSPLRGTVRVVVVLVDFSDKAMTQPKQHFEELFFSTGVLPHGSVREYYKEASNSLVDIQGQVLGPYRLPKKLSEYAHGDSGTGSTAPNARTMAYDAAVAANPDVNFAGYDNDGDGYVDAFIVLHAGSGAEVTGDAGDIWSHKWVLAGGAYNADGTQVYAYLTVPEDSNIGVCCHELGHLVFGWPDLYDTDYSSEGIGNWCLMAGGSWNGGGDIPAHPSAWCKADQGWVSVAVQSSNGNLSIPDVKTSKVVHRLWKDGTAGSEYFLLENRQRTGSDQQLPGDGLLIWHIDETIASNSDENHPKVSLMQSDGKRDLEQGVNRGDASDPYPGTSGITAFNKSSTPSSKSYAGSDTCVSVSNISASGPVMTAKVAVKCVVIKSKKEVKEFHKEFKEFRKDFLKDKDIKERFKEIKEFKEKEFKEFKEFKEKEKPPKEKDKDIEGPGGWPGGDWSQSASNPGTLEERLASIESRLSAIEPFIGSEMRPDLRQSALASEADMQELHDQMLQGAAGAKRLYDTHR